MKKYSDEFEYFWKKYPARWNSNLHKYVKRKKYPAWLMWQRLDEDTQREILSKARLIKESEGSCPRDAVTWLHPENQRGWEDIDMGEGWKPVLPEELAGNALKDAKEEKLNMGTRRTLLIRQIRGA